MNVVGEVLRREVVAVSKVLLCSLKYTIKEQMEKTKDYRGKLDPRRMCVVFLLLSGHCLECNFSA